MSLLVRFSGILAALVVTLGLVILGFATAQSGFLFVGLFCAWPFLWGVAAWTVRGLRDNYQLIPKAPAVSRTRATRPAATQEQY